MLMKKVLTLLTLLMAFAINGFSQDTWTVAGTAVNGDAWAPDNTANDMTKGEDGLWTLTVENLVLEKGTTYKYKVVKNHAWDEAYPAQDKEFTVDETGTYKVVYTFNEETKAVSEQATKTGEGEAGPHVYSIAGSPESVFGAAWSETATATEMTLVDGLYTWKSAEVELTAGKIEFKVVVDHSWGVAYPSSNYVLNIEADGKYTITITFNEETKEVNATATKAETTEPEPEPQPVVINSMAIVGELTGGWPTDEDWSMAKAMTQDAENAAIWTLTIEGFEAEAKAYKYKAAANGKWGDYELPAEGDQEFAFGTDEYPAGKYNLTFTANTEENTLTLAVEKVEEQPALNTYTATFTTNAKWEKAYAYAWSGEGESVVKFLGDWPGTPLEATDGVYTVTISAAAAPEKIIFNNGKSEDFVKQQTEDLDFEDGKAYTFTVPSPAFEDGSYYIQNIANGLFLAAGQDFAGAEGTLFGFTFDESLGAYSITGNDFFAWDNKKWYVVGDATSFKAYYILNNKKYYLALSERNGWVVYDEGNELMTDDNSTWCIKPKTTEPVITSMAIVGDLTGGWPVKDEVSGEEDWSMAKAMTQDAENPAVWTLTIEGFEAEAKIYEYKATANGKWGDYELPNPGNLEIEFGTELNPVGKYNLTFVVNTDDGTLTLTPVKAETTEPEQTTWTVAGTAVNGESWKQDNTANDMTKGADNLWTLTVEGLTLEKGTTYKYKVVKNHAWDEAYPSSDKEFTVEETAVYTVVYTFNEETKEVSEAATKTGDAVAVTHIYSIAGSPESIFGATWDQTATATEMKLVDGLYTWTSAEVELAANTDVEFKVVADHDWGVAYPSSNYLLNIEEAGKYTITVTFNEETKEVNATANKAEEQPVLNTYTATFTNEAGWEKVYAYAFTNAGDGNVTEFLGAWPGTELTAGEGGIYAVTIQAAAAPAFIIFNNGITDDEGKAQTADLAFEDKGEYTNKVEEQPVLNTYTVTFTNEAGWEKVYAYAWTTTLEGEVPVTNEFLGEWPGKELTAGEDGKFVVTIVAEAAPAFIIFNNGAGTQTEDLAFEDGKTYVYEIPVEPVNHTWDFTQWSDETVDNLKAEAAKVTVEDDPDNAGKTMCTNNGALWSDHEKANKCDTYGASKDNCFWYVGGEAAPTANGVAIKELKGLEFNTSYGTARSLAIAVNYPTTSLGDYKGGAYLWLGGKGKECFTIKNVKVGSTLTIGAESHKPAEGRGIQLKINGENFGDAFTPTTFAENSWTITSTDESVKVVDVVVTNTNGCHLYYIDADIAEVPVADGYYLAGSMNNWAPTEADALQENTEAAGEYMKTLDMTAQTEIKVVKVENFAIAAWYPAEGANYVISEDANYTVYFRPDGNTEWENGFFFVQKNDATGIATLKALQENGAAIYNLSGQRVSVAKKGLYIVNGRKVVVK